MNIGARAAWRLADQEGLSVEVLHLYTLFPLPVEIIQTVARRVEFMLVPELNLGQYAREVSWRPFLLGPILKQQGLNDSPFNVFAITMVLQYRRIGPWRDYLVGEKTYMVMSLVAKSLLAWQVFSGTLRPGG